MARYDCLLEIKIPGATVFLTAREINRLLLYDPELFAVALKRGKGIIRARAARKRQAGGRRCE